MRNSAITRCPARLTATSIMLRTRSTSAMVQYEFQVGIMSISRTTAVICCSACTCNWANARRDAKGISCDRH